MRNSALLTLHSSIYAVFAAALFFVPATLWPLYGVELNDKYATFLSQHNRIFLGGIAIRGFLFRDIDENSLVARKLFLGLAWTNVLGFAITLFACLIGVFVGFGWSDPAFFAFLSVVCFLQARKNQRVAE